MLKYKFAKSFLFIFILICFVVISYNKSTPWIKVYSKTIHIVTYDDTTNTIWLVDDLERTLYKLDYPLISNSNFGSAEKIEIPNDTVINSVCASNNVWMSSFILSIPPSPVLYYKSTVPNTISRYKDKESSWHSVKETEWGAQCKTLKDKSVVFWTQNEIIRYNDKGMQVQHFITNWNIMDVVDDWKNNLWVSTAIGEIYRQNDSQNDWILVDTLAPDSYPRLFIDASGNLWATSGSFIKDSNKFIYQYSYDSLSSAPSSKKMFEGASVDRWRNIFQDKNGRIWAVATNKLLIKRSGQFQEVPSLGSIM